jgi:LPXTG-motif cell wall-anchored protein
MKRFLIAVFAVALLASFPLVAQEYEEPDVTESELQPEADLQTEGDIDADVDADVDVDADLDVDDDADMDDDLTTDDDFGDEELPATGSELPLAGALGLLSLAGAVALRSRS